MEREEKIAKSIVSVFHGQIFTLVKDANMGDVVEIGFNIFKGWIQVGMGGEWWSGNVGLGKNVLHHKKEKVDPAYKPVVVVIKERGDDIVLFISGGFGYEAEAVISIEG